MKLAELEVDGQLGGSAMKYSLARAEFTEGGQYLKVGGRLDYNDGAGGGKHNPSEQVRGRRMIREPTWDNTSHRVIIYNMENGLPVSKEEDKFLWYEAFTSDGSYCIDGFVIKDSLTEQVVYNIEMSPLANVCFNMDDKLVVIRSQVMIIDWRYGKIEGMYQLPAMGGKPLLYKRLAVLFCMVNDPSMGPPGLYRIDLTTLEMKRVSSDQTGIILDCSFDARKVLLNNGRHPNHQLTVVNVETGSSIPIPGKDRLSGNSFSSDGKYLIGMTPDKPSNPASSTLEIYDTDTGKLHADITSRKNKFLNATFIGDGTKITTIHEDNTIGLWDLTTGELIKVQPLRAY